MTKTGIRPPQRFEDNYPPFPHNKENSSIPAAKGRIITGSKCRLFEPFQPNYADFPFDFRSIARIAGDRAILFAMEPIRTTVPELEGILSELSSREPIFHRPEFGTTRADFERMSVEDYWEIGASGRIYSRAFVLDELERRFSVPHSDVWETSDFHCSKLSEDTYLLTYTLLQDNQRLTRRSTIWRRTADGWKIVYHQGTIVQDA